MTIAKEDREFLELFRQATPEGKRLMVIELIALNRLDGQAGREIPKCSRAEYKRHIKALRKGRFSHLWDCKNGHNLGIIALKTTKNY